MKKALSIALLFFIFSCNKGDDSIPTNTGLQEKTASVKAAPSNSPYKVYVALVHQTETSTPIAVVKQNTFTDSPVWNYVSDGVYSITSNDFANINPVVFMSNGNTPYTILSTAGNGNVQYVYTIVNGLPSNNAMSNMSIEIRVYN